VRLGRDAEGVLSIDNGALRIAPLVEAGFGRAVLAYGPFATRAGLAFSVRMLNGHNTAQAQPLPDTFFQRLDLWMRGSRTDGRWRRLVQWLRSGRVVRALWQFQRWRRAEKGKGAAQLLDENLAVGWFASAAVADPRTEGNGFIMHALGPENGELWTGHPANRTKPLRGVQNVPLHFLAVVRGGGTVYYASSLDRVPGLTPHPWVRPLAIDSGTYPDQAYVGIHQSVLGQIGWRLDTRVQGVRVARLAGYDTWWGGAHAADRLSQGVIAAEVEAEIGGRWRLVRHSAQRGVADGGDCAYPAAIALLDPGAPSGLVHAVVKPCATGCGGVGLVWRYQDESNHWRLEIDGKACKVIRVAEGISEIMALRATDGVVAKEKRLQVLDDGYRVMAYLEGEPMANAWLMDARLADATKVGVRFLGSDARDAAIRSFEAHPRRIRLPEAFDVGGAGLRTGGRVVVADDFSGERADLDGRVTPTGQACWKRLIGGDAIEVSGSNSARVRASPQEPCLGRTAYCVDWPHPDFADLEAVITPPGDGAGQRHRTTAGFILYQDPTNYVILNAWRSDEYGGGSVSTFFTFRGFEDIYDAVWTNVADRVYYGKPFRLRLCSDGERYVAFVDDEAVLYRALKDVYPDMGPLRIRKVGLVANWEFGTDTGSQFEQCTFRH
jgi:hypothetical protein